MFAIAASGKVLFIHSLDAADPVLASTLKQLDANATSLTAVALGPGTPASAIAAAGSDFDAVFSALALPEDALAAALSQIIAVLKPGGKYIHGLKVRGVCIPRVVTAGCVAHSHGVCSWQLSDVGGSSLALMLAGFTNLEVMKDAEPASEVRRVNFCAMRSRV